MGPLVADSRDVCLCVCVNGQVFRSYLLPANPTLMMRLFGAILQAVMPLGADFGPAAIPLKRLFDYMVRDVDGVVTGVVAERRGHVNVSR